MGKSTASSQVREPRRAVPVLAHYTTETAVPSILEHGFLTIPSPRLLICQLLNMPPHDEEPQRFGMVSFTRLRVFGMRHHRRVFGDYAIVVNAAWARRKGARRVIYVPSSGPRFDEWSAYFRAAHRRLQERRKASPWSDDAAWDMAFLSSHMAAVRGAPEWAQALRVYEFLQTSEHVAQEEWRIVSNEPTGFNTPSEDRNGLVREALAFSKWKLACVTIEPKDVACVLAPKNRIPAVRECLPPGFEQIDVRPHGILSHLQVLLAERFK